MLCFNEMTFQLKLIKLNEVKAGNNNNKKSYTKMKKKKQSPFQFSPSSSFLLHKMNLRTFTPHKFLLFFFFY